MSDTTAVRQLEKQPEYAATHQLLQLFACGVYMDYVRGQASLPELSPMQLLKLRHLTIVTMSTKTKCIPYSDLLKELGLESTRELEDIIISAIYSGVIRGKLDQRGGRLEIEYAAGRDVRPEAVPHVIATLEAWCRTCDTVMQCVEQQINVANDEKEARALHKASVDSKVQATRKSLKSQEQDEPMASDSKETVSTSEKAKKLKTKSAKASSSKLWRS